MSLFSFIQSFLADRHSPIIVRKYFAWLRVGKIEGHKVFMTNCIVTDSGMAFKGERSFMRLKIFLLILYFQSRRHFSAEMVLRIW